MISHNNRKRGAIKTELTAEEIKQNEQLKIILDTFLAKKNILVDSNTEINFGNLYEYSSDLIKVLNDIPSITNFRQKLIKYYLKNIAPNKNTEELIDFFISDLKFMSNITLTNPKSYNLWFYRVFIITLIIRINKDFALKILNNDIEGTVLFLKKDSRNFHVWNYRNYLLNIKIDNFKDNIKETLDSEIEFIDTKIDEDFSNYSALHFKSKYIDLYYKLGLSKDIIQQINYAFDKVKDGIVICEKEQSIWNFINWILKFILSNFITVILSHRITDNNIIINYINKDNCKLEEFITEKSLNKIIFGSIINESGCLRYSYNFNIILTNILSYLSEIEGLLNYKSFNYYYIVFKSNILLLCYNNIENNTVDKINNYIKNYEFINEDNNFYLNQLILLVKEYLKHKDLNILTKIIYF